MPPARATPQSPLALYGRKRDFDATPEPGPRVGRRKRSGLVFVIQRHEARRLHYDFRLELDGVLKSWAVTREPSETPGEKRLAVHVEDHPIAYATFHGDIPEGHYGAGHVDIWDRGTWQPIGDPHEGYRSGKLDFELDGERLKGRFVLLRMRSRAGDRRDNWLLIPRSDGESKEPGESKNRSESKKPRKTAPHPALRAPLSGAAGEGTRARRSAAPLSPRAVRRAGVRGTTVAGVAISNPTRPIAAAPGAVKADLARYYEAVAGWFLPQIAKRPLALVKCPGGDFSHCFFQKHAGDPRRASERPADDPPYMRLSTLRAAIEAVQNGAVEFHTWGVSFPNLDKPDRLILDLDPDADVTWTRFREAADHVRALLDDLELAWFVKTTGGKGLHFVLPLVRRHGWTEVKGFAEALARRLTRERPDLFIATASKAQRKGLVFVDWLRNTDGATAVAAYALRARADLPVSMPIDWRELAQDVRGAHFNWRNVPDILRRRKTDPWAQYEASRQRLTDAQRKALQD
jgi:bifunctional non-homologous end joining protein LigD